MRIVYDGPTPSKFFPAHAITLQRRVPTFVPDAFGEQLIKEDPRRYMTEADWLSKGTGKKTGPGGDAP